AEDLGLRDRVVFLGEVPDEEVPLYYHACDLFVLPASERSEAFGVVQIEAMACGKPVICTELGTGTSYVNVHGETGLVVPPRDPSALAEAIGRLLADGELRREMGKRGRKRAARAFSKEAMMDRVMRLYEALLST
ncbi:MAG TPA: glycosyltransferase, partial [Anaerolineae bacterium]|nr:glycosyltransferase [Anaerolineae bacterium]